MMFNLEPDEVSDADLDRVAGGTTVTNSNNAALAKKPTFTSILTDNGTGTSGPGASSNIGTQPSPTARLGKAESA